MSAICIVNLKKHNLKFEELDNLAKELVRMNYATIKNDMVIIREDGGLYGYVGEKHI